ncbi:MULTISPECIES: DNA-processing protein DprA [unclassified Novosphingobium]|uniref:DNA-processing protein DprA n=1 Tax=unclassified Novosphingobium TaxID=2644732 RepID=UPI000869D364|nr:MULTISPECIES: DNA-processing protein DprA [unclassified Novosphingobium]MBN9145599.1 DNA-processing protein DprA [Novosphingobium sp.]MDR6709474.1 DNA processing protein [Novosphingobium sp. 1748]ODU80785.1 MAG: DNA protecting protein DprA [Novosphingobium sp. SCN 63-17]OJX87934.1 MAG: DNA protecting protein DprA [Novosphingobium sp. 63-713]
MSETGEEAQSGTGFTLTREEGLARIRLIRSPNIGPVTFGQLLRRFGDARRALDALPDLAARGDGRASGKGRQPYRAVDPGVVEAEIKAVRAAGARYIFHDSPDYPPLLRQVDSAPPLLIARGRADLSRAAPVAMVGARNASAGAMRLAREIAGGLAEAGYPVVSGLARGIDAAAHEGALAGRGEAYTNAGTIAVIAGGIDIAYPPDHAALQSRIAEEGLLLTEAPPGVEPTQRHFPARNRIIAGIAAGTVVVEAALKSGSLITARLAGDYGREVMAVPGSPLDPRSHGCNEMIRDGAILIQRAEDIIELIASFDGVPRSHFHEEDHGPLDGFGGESHFEKAQEAPEDADGSTDANDRIAALLGLAPVGVDEIVRQSGLSAGGVQMALIELELAGVIQRHAGGRVSRIL